MRFLRREIIRNPWLLAFLGCLVFFVITITLNLPSHILIGEKGQAAIEMLNAMRRPFLEIKTAEALLIGAGWTKMAFSDFNKAVESGNNLLARYRRLAEYNPELSRSVSQLAEAYEDWLSAERKLFDHFRDDSISENSPLLETHIIKDLHASSAGFLNTMDRLGEGEIPIHKDISNGRMAVRTILTLLGLLFLYMIGLIIFQQRTRTRELELEVAMTTADLREANRGLAQEIIERKEAQEEIENALSLQRATLESTADGILVVNDEGKMVGLNQRFVTMWRIPESIVASKNDNQALAYVLDQLKDPEGFLGKVRELYSKPDAESYDTLEFKDGRLFERYSRPQRIGERVVGRVWSFRDVTDLKRTERRLAVQYAVVRVLAESAGLNEATPKIIQAICETTGWDMGAIWFIDRGANLLRCVDCWHLPTVDISEFEAITREFTFASGIGLPGRVWAGGKPAWSIDVTMDANFPRAPYAVKVGLHSALGFPVMFGGGVLGVIEFFSREIRQVDKELLDMFAAIGSQIGQFIERTQAEKEIENSLSLLRATLESTADGILVVNNEGKMVSFNQRFVEMWHIPKSIVVSHDDNQALTFVLDQLKGPEIFINRVRELYSQPDAESFDLLEFKDERLFERYSRPQLIGGKSVGRVWSFRDVTERKEAEEKIKHMAYHDSLTDLPNRALFYDRLHQAILSGQRENGPVALLILDLDGFKEINDTAGHHCGDLMLQAVGQRLRGIVRKSDTVARLGGDEFALLLPGTSMEGATLTADKILETIKTPFSLEGQVFNIGVSIGIALFPEHSEDSSILLQKADMAMYQAKGSGTGYALYVPGEGQG